MEPPLAAQVNENVEILSIKFKEGLKKIAFPQKGTKF